MDFFLNKTNKIREIFTNIPAYHPRQLDTPQQRKYAPVTQGQLATIVKLMPAKACQLDVIPTDWLKQVLEGSLPALTHITNRIPRHKSIQWGMERSNSQTSNKKPSAGLGKTNYRLVSNLGFTSKVVQKVILTQFTKHYNENRLLPTYQSAYRKNHSCETSLVKLVDDILLGMEEQLVISVVILDLAAAFDTVDHDLLLDVLEKRFGVTDNTTQWYQNCLKSAKFRVITDKDKSEPRQKDYSVPQGSFQGAFLSISYTSTLDEIVKDLTLNGFANDHGVRKTFRSSWLDHQWELSTIAIIEKSMLDIKSWMDAVQLKMNDSKTEFIYFGGPRQLQKCIVNQIDVNGEMIPWSHTTRYLGAYLDSVLN